MASYHIGSSGKPTICRASKNPCPLGGQHFGSREAAQKFVDDAAMAKLDPTLGKLNDVNAAAESVPRATRVEQAKSVSAKLTKDFINELKSRPGKRSVNVFWAGHSSQVPDQFRVASSVKALDEFLVMGMGDDAPVAFKVEDYLVRRHPSVFSGLGVEWTFDGEVEDLILDGDSCY